MIVSASGLFGLLTDVARTAETDTALPIFNCVQLFGVPHGDRFVLVANSTDRYVLAQAWMPAVGGLDVVVVPMDQVKLILTSLKPYAKVPVNVTLSLAADNLIVQVGELATFAARTVDAGFPDVTRFLEMPTEHDSSICLDPRRLENFTAVARRRGEKMVVTTNAGMRATHIHIGDSYHGVIMPYGGTPETPSAPLFERPESSAEAA